MAPQYLSHLYPQAKFLNHSRNHLYLEHELEHYLQQSNLLFDIWRYFFSICFVKKCSQYLPY